jgi:perosamine synthetase
MLAARRKIAQQYGEAFAEIDALEIPLVMNDRESSWHLYPLRIRPHLLSISRDEFVSALKKRGIGTSVHFIPLHLHPYYGRKFGYKVGDMPRAEAEYKRYFQPDLIFVDLKMPGISGFEVIEKVREIVNSSIRANLYVAAATD